MSVEGGARRSELMPGNHCRGLNGNSRRANPLLHNSTVLIRLRVQHLDSRPVHRPRTTALLPAVRVVGDLCWQLDWMPLEPLRLHRSPSRPRIQPQVFHAGRVSIVWCDLAIPCGYVQLWYYTRLAFFTHALDRRNANSNVNRILVAL